MKVYDAVEAILAILVVGGIVVIAVYDSINGKPVDIPPELQGFGLLVLGSYFRGRSINGTVTQLTTALRNSVPAEGVLPNVATTTAAR